MENNHVNEQQLLSLIEGKCSTDESRKIKDVIATSKEVEDKYDELLKMHNLMSDHPLVDAPNGFVHKVMNNLTSKKIIVEDLFDSINKLGIKLLISFLLLLAVGTVMIAENSININLKALTPKSKILNLQPINIDSFISLFDDKLLVNGILFIATILALVVFDRVVLRPWFSNRNQLQ